MPFPAPEKISTNGIELEVFSAGTGRPIVACHGWPEHAYSWRHQFAPLVDAGFHVIAPNQRGYGGSARPERVTDYDITHLTDDLVGLLDHYGYQDALFLGHDWGAIVVWNLAMMHPNRVSSIINLSVPFMPRGPSEWVGFWESALGENFYIVHFNRQPGVADRHFDTHRDQFLNNLYRTKQWLYEPAPAAQGMPFLSMASAEHATGEPLLKPEELKVFSNAFALSGFTGGINWYRNFTHNWGIIGDYKQHISQPTLMIYGDHDMVPALPDLDQYVENLSVVNLPCGHWIQQECPQETTQAILTWLDKHYRTST